MPKNPSRPSAQQGGFTLVEVLVATAILTGVLASVVQLAVLTTRSNVLARDASYASVLASQKLNELNSVMLSALPVSSPDAWMRTSGGALEYLDALGRVVSSGGTPPGDAVYVRRWSITPIAGDLTGGVVIQVAAGRVRRLSSGALADADPADVARVVGLKTGTAP